MIHNSRQRMKRRVKKKENSYSWRFFLSLSRYLCTTREKEQASYRRNRQRVFRRRNTNWVTSSV